MGFREVLRVFWLYHLVYIVVGGSLIAAMIHNIHRNPQVIGWLGLVAAVLALVWMRLVMRRGDRYWDERNG